MILQSLAGLPAFLACFCAAIIAVVAYLLVYTRVTPHNEFQLIRDDDPAAAIALGLRLVGFLAAGGQRHRACRQRGGLPDLEPDRTGRFWFAGPRIRLWRRVRRDAVKTPRFTCLVGK